MAVKKIVIAVTLPTLLIAGLAVVFIAKRSNSISNENQNLHQYSRVNNVTHRLNIDQPKAASIQPLGLDSTNLSGSISTPKEHDNPSFAQSLNGTEIDGALQVGDDGRLVLDQEVRDFFDYFLSASDELGAEQAIAEIQHYIDTYLPERAAKQAHELLGNYLRYKQFEFGLQSQPLAVNDLNDIDSLQVLRDSFDSLRAKKAELFSPAQQQALFGLEEAYQDYTLETLELFADDALDDQQRLAALTELETNLPPQLQASRLHDAEHRQQQQQLANLTSQIDDDAQLHQALIERGVDYQKADELVSYRQQQTQFENDYQGYRAAVSRLDSQDAVYDQKLAALRNAFFATPEQQTQARLRDLSTNN